MRTFKIYSPGKFPVHNTVLLTLVTLLCIRSPELILKWKSCALGQIPPHFSHTLTPVNHHSTLFLWVWIFQIPHISGIMQYWSFSIWLISLSIMPSSFIHIVANSRLPSFLMDFPGGTSGKELTRQCKRHKRHGFDPWVLKIPCRRALQPTPVFLLGESHVQRSLAGYSPCGRKESDMTKAT